MTLLVLPSIATRWLVGVAALSAGWLHAAPALADCGDQDCGPHGTCSNDLLARCDCEPGWFSLRVHFGRASLGAYCVPEPAPAATPGCDASRCEPHGTCQSNTEGDGDDAACVCDDGYRLTDSGGCEDDPADDAESACMGVRCGEGNACLPTPQGPTCRCLKGGDVVLGSADDGAFGPLCNMPADPRVACGPDGCGPYGECVVSQIARCKCDPGASVEILVAPDGEERPYCVDPEKPAPNGVERGPLSDAGMPTEMPNETTADGGSPDAASPVAEDGGAAPAPALDAGLGADAGTPSLIVAPRGCACRTGSTPTETHRSGLPFVTGWLALALAALLVRRAPARRAASRIDATPRRYPAT